MRYTPENLTAAFFAMFTLPAFGLTMLASIGAPSPMRVGVSIGAGAVALLVTAGVYIACEVFDAD